MSYFFKSMLILFVLVALQACDLSLQRSYDFDYEDHPPEPEPLNMSIYEYLTQNSEFDSLIVAINRAGMQNTYNDESSNKTVLMLRNEAFEEFMNNNQYNSINEIPVGILENLLNYHIINESIMQKDLNIREYYLFQTRIEGPDGLIKLWKHNDHWQIFINDDGGPEFPETSKGTAVYHHNFDFNNGVGHQLVEYVRRVPFE